MPKLPKKPKDKAAIRARKKAKKDVTVVEEKVVAKESRQASPTKPNPGVIALKSRILANSTLRNFNPKVSGSPERGYFLTLVTPKNVFFGVKILPNGKARRTNLWAPKKKRPTTIEWNEMVRLVENAIKAN
jgi:hypothetical protein